MAAEDEREDEIPEGFEGIASQNDGNVAQTEGSEAPRDHAAPEEDSILRRLRIISAWAQERVARQRHVDFEHRWRKNVMEDLVEERNRCATLVEAVREEREYRLKPLRRSVGFDRRL